MEYTTVFDVSQSGFRNWWFPAFGILFVAIGSGLVLFGRPFPSRGASFFSYSFFGFSIFWTLLAFALTAGDYWGLASALRNGRCEVTEGIVSDFHPMPESGHGSESFIVNGKSFEYSDYSVIAGFNNTASHGGPIHQGLQVRIHYQGNDIAKLEIAR